MRLEARVARKLRSLADVDELTQILPIGMVAVIKTTHKTRTMYQRILKLYNSVLKRMKRCGVT